MKLDARGSPKPTRPHVVTYQDTVIFSHRHENIKVTVYLLFYSAGVKEVRMVWIDEPLSGGLLTHIAMG
jgi:hypothetical protein